MLRRIPLILLLLPLAVPAVAQDFGTIAEQYKERVLRDLEVAERLDFVERVARFDNEDAAKLLLDSVKDLGEKVNGLRTRILELEVKADDFAGPEYKKKDKWDRVNECREEVKRLDEVLTADLDVLEGIGKAVRGLTDQGAQRHVEVVAGRGSTWYQRGLAAQAAAIYPTKEGREAALKALEDREARVVIQALDGLIERKDPETVTAIAKCLLHDVWVVQSNAAKALASIGAPSAVRPLIEALLKTDGRVRGDINDALKQLTGENFDADYEIWKRYYEEHKDRFEGPDAKPLRRGRQRPADDSEYYGIKTPSKRIVYVIDVSHSMLLEIGGGTITPKPGEEDRPTGPKIEVAKSELKNAIRKLKEDAFFNIIVFNNRVKVWEKSMLKATQANKNKAYLYVRGLKASGSTYTYGALREAFKLAGMGALDPNYDSGVDTIFLLSDGAPTDQSFPTSKLMDPEVILKAVRGWNKLQKVVIHAIAIDPNATKGTAFVRFMKDLAEQNGGQYAERN